nr:putative RNA-dependent RNA polymerase [Dicistroviridae sp.]
MMANKRSLRRQRANAEISEFKTQGTRNNVARVTYEKKGKKAKVIVEEEEPDDRFLLTARQLYRKDGGSGARKYRNKRPRHIARRDDKLEQSLMDMENRMRNLRIKNSGLPGDVKKKMLSLPLFEKATQARVLLGPSQPTTGSREESLAKLNVHKAYIIKRLKLGGQPEDYSMHELRLKLREDVVSQSGPREGKTPSSCLLEFCQASAIHFNQTHLFELCEKFDAESQGGIFSAPDKFNEMCTAFTELAQKSGKAAADQFADAAAKTAMAMEDVIDGLAHAKGVSGFFSAMGSNLLHFLDFLYELFCGGYSAVFCPVLATVLMIYEYRGNVLSPLWQIVLGFTGGISVFQAIKLMMGGIVESQSGEEQAFTGFAKILVSALGLTQAELSIDGFTKLLMRLGSSFKGIEGIIKSVIDIFSYLRQYLPGCVSSDSISEPEFLKFKTAVDDIVVSHNDGSEFVSLKTIADIKLIIVEGNKLATDLNARGKTTLANACLNCVTKLTTILSDMNLNSKVKSHRPEPVCIGLFGDPNQGKTSVCDLFKREFVSNAYPNFTPEQVNSPEYYYSRRLDQYWEGIDLKTKVVTFDDFAQSKDVPGSGTSHFLDLINIVNGHPFYPNMAFNMKGKLCLEPDLILLSSNARHINPNSVNCAQAVTRRIHLPYLLTLTAGTTTSTDRWRFEKAEFNATNSLVGTGQYMTYSQVMSEALSLRRLHEQKHLEFEALYSGNVVNNQSVDDLLDGFFDEDIELDSLSTDLSVVESQCNGSSHEDISFIEVPSHIPDPLIPAARLHVYRFYSSRHSDGRSWRAFKRTSGEGRARLVEIALRDFKHKPDLAFVGSTYHRVFSEMSGGIVGKVVAIATGLALASAYIVHCWTFAERMFPTPQSTQNKVPPNPVNLSRIIPNPHAQSGRSQNFDDVLKACSSNIVSLEIAGAKGKQNLGFGLGIKDHWMVIPFHYAYEIASFLDVEGPESKAKVLLTFKGNTFECDPTELFADVSKHFTDKEIAFVKVPVQFRDITVHFISEMKMAVVRTTQCFTSGCIFGKNISNFVNASYVSSQHVRGVVRYVAHDLLRYSVHTVKGDCGQPVLLETPQPKISGIHVAGHASAKAGYASVITKEFLAGVFGTPFIEDEPSVVPNFAWNPYVDAEFQSFPSALKTSTHSKCNIVPSSDVLYKEPFTKPIVPSEHNYKVALSKYLAPRERNFAEENLRACSHAMFQDLTEALGERSKRLYTINEAIFGIEGSNFRPIDMSTSAGFPLNCKGIKKSRFVKDGKPTKHFNELVDMCNEAAGLLCEGTAPPFYYTDTVKMERLAKDKVDKGKVRLISASPLVLSILFRSMFGAFIHAMNDNPIRSRTAIGLNPYSSDWALLAESLLDITEDEESTGAGDYSAYDASLFPFLLECVLDGILTWYGKDDPWNDVRIVLWGYVTRSQHIRGSEILLWFASLPSGFTMTTVTGSLANLIVYYYFFLRVNNNRVSELKNFRKHVFVCVLGDDNIYSVSKKYKDLFTEVHLSQYAAELGLTYTSDVKGAANSQLRNIRDITFLKRSFRYDCGWYAPLNLETILETPLWTRTSDPDNIRKTNCVFAAKELSLHGEKIFGQWIHKIDALCGQPGMVPLSYQLALSECVDTRSYY